MTRAVCMNCGKVKFGALVSCPSCEPECSHPSAFEDDYVGISILLTDHYLSEEELGRIGDAIRVIHTTGLDDGDRYELLGYFLSRKWPKLLVEYQIDAVGFQMQRKLDTLFRSELAGLLGQEYPDLELPVHLRHAKSEATSSTLQAARDPAQLSPILAVIRWALFVPAACIVSWVAYFLMYFISENSMVLSGVSPDSFFLKVNSVFLSHTAMGCAFPYVAAKVAPHYRVMVGFCSTGFIFLVVGFVFFPAVINSDYWSIWGGVSVLLGAGAFAYSAGTGKSKL